MATQQDVTDYTNALSIDASKHELIQSGSLYPTATDLLFGRSWFLSDINADITAWADRFTHTPNEDINNRIRLEIKLFAADVTALSIDKFIANMNEIEADSDILFDTGIENTIVRAHIYAASKYRSKESCRLLISHCLKRMLHESSVFNVNKYISAAVYYTKLLRAKNFDAYDVERDVSGIREALNIRSEIEEILAAPPPPDYPAAVVVPKLPVEIQHSAIRKKFEKAAGAPMRLKTFARPAELYETLTETYPWAESSIESVCKELGRSDVVRLRPTLFVGPPGSGKTSLARRLLSELGVQPTIFSCAGVADSAFGGTSRQWSSARECVPLQCVARTGLANPGVVLDELEKAGTGTHNGSLIDALVALTERANARGYFDPGIEVPVDLSHIVYVATANSLDRLPSALRDRFRIVNVPAPGPEHIETVVRSMLDAHADEQNIDRRWIPDLAADELDTLRRVWRGGSLRPLQAAVQATLSLRDGLSLRM